MPPLFPLPHPCLRAQSCLHSRLLTDDVSAELSDAGGDGARDQQLLVTRTLVREYERQLSRTLVVSKGRQDCLMMGSLIPSLDLDDTVKDGTRVYVVWLLA